MISLRKHLDAFSSRPRTSDVQTPAAEGSDTTDNSTVSCVCTMLGAVSESGRRAVPELGDELINNLRQIEEAFTRLKSPANLETTSNRVRAELARWADRAFQHHADNEREIKEIIKVVARTSETVAERDQKYAAQIGDVGTRLSAIAEYDDLSLMRRAIIESTRTLKSCVEKMTEESRQTMQKLTGEVADYRDRLEASERISVTDELTQLSNRRAFEAELETRLMGRQTFSVIMIDLNGFKEINDRYGHLAGDDLLKQFAGELRLQFMSGDVIARWGGDEFAALVYGEFSTAEARVERIRRWAFGDYKLAVEGGLVRVAVKGAIGAAAWDWEESGAALLARADKCLYADKGNSPARRQSDRP